jgi:teichuronic acid biosynthesis glycosyltransferase TuaG
MPLVSVVVTTYNRKEFLAETLNSILNQTFQDFELIVVDNFSNYDFFAFIDEFDNNKIIPFQNQNNAIIAINRNFGIQKAKGKFVAFCDDDDIWLPEKLEKQITLITNNTANDINVLVYSEVVLFGENKKEKIFKNRQIKGINDLIKANKITLSSALVSKSNLLEFDEDKLLVACEDFELWLKLLKNGYKLFYLPEPLLKYRVCSNSFFSSNSYNIHLKTVYALLKLVLKYGTSEIIVFKYIYIICIELLKFVIKKILMKIKC